MPQIAYESDKCKKWVNENIHIPEKGAMLYQFVAHTDEEGFKEEIKRLRAAGFKEGIDFSFRKIW